LPQVSTLDNSVLSKPIEKSEILNTLKEIDYTKSPGSDGLFSLFYIKYYHLFGDTLLKIFQLCYDEGEM
jgi:hypothetical protein